MKRFTRRERDTLAVGPGGDISEAEANLFARIEPNLPKGTLLWEHRAIRFGPFCGVLRAGDVMVELLPKTHDGLAAEHSDRGLVVGMLRLAGALRQHRVDEVALSHQRMHLLDLFIRDFCDQVQGKLRTGPIARYEDQIDNLHTIRGRLSLTEHLRQNAFDQSRLYCAFDERTADNPFNRVLRAVLRRLLGRCLGVQTRGLVAALLHRFDGVSNCKVTHRDIERLVFDRTIEHWEPVFAQARWLLQGLFPDLRLGESVGSALLFNMEQLFETVLAVRLRIALAQANQGAWQVEKQGPQRYLAGSHFLLRPDITISNADKLRAIVDAKWKRLDPTQSNADVSSSDAYQMTAYATRYRCQRLALAYPAWRSCRPGTVASFDLDIPNGARLDVVAIDLHDLAFGKNVPQGLDATIGCALDHPKPILPTAESPGMVAR